MEVNQQQDGKIPQRASSIKRLPFSFIKTSTAQLNTVASRNNSNASIYDQPQPTTGSPKLVDDNYFLYSNNNPNSATTPDSTATAFVESATPTTTTSTLNRTNTLNMARFKSNNNYVFTRSTLKTSSFNNYRRYSRSLSTFSHNRI